MTTKTRDNSWKEFGTILRFELKNFLTHKGYLGITIFMVVALALLMFFPRVTGRQPGNSMSAEDFIHTEVSDILPTGPKEGTILVRSDGTAGDALEQAFSAAFSEYEVRLTTDSDEQIRAAVENEEAVCAFLLNGATDYTYVVKTVGMYDARPAVADEVLRNLYISDAFAERGVEPAEAMEIVGVGVTHEVENLGKDQGKNFFYTYIMIFALYMIIMIYGTIVAGSVASEKTSRAMELLITSARSKSLMFGKIIGAGLAGLIQMGVIFGAALLFYRINAGAWGEAGVVSSMFNIPPYLLGFMLLFFVLGYFLYACLFGAFGSTVSRTEDVQMATMPAMFGIIIMFMVVIISVSSGNVENTLLKVCSFIPFTSPMAMFARIAMTEVPAWQIILSVGILVVTVYGVGVLAAKIYRMGVLLYGNAMKPAAVLKALATSEKAK